MSIQKSKGVFRTQLDICSKITQKLLKIIKYTLRRKTFHCVKNVQILIFLVHVFLYSIQIFDPNKGKYRPEKKSIGNFFTLILLSFMELFDGEDNYTNDMNQP